MGKKDIVIRVALLLLLLTGGVVFLVYLKNIGDEQAVFEDDSEEPFLRETLPGEPVGPGGCKGITECAAYCAEHSDECFSFVPSETPPSPGTTSPPGKVPPKPHEPPPIPPAPPFPTSSSQNGTKSEPPLTAEFVEALGKALIEELGSFDENAPLDSAGPGGCSTVRRCWDYCVLPAHYDECAAFGGE